MNLMNGVSGYPCSEKTKKTVKIIAATQKAF
jgi:hypothetical protein